MEKRTNKYKLNLELLATAKVDDAIYTPIELEFDNHDNIFTIIERMKQRNIFHTENQAVEFAIGLKMFSEVMLKNRENPLFSEFRPAFSEFMKKLKSS
jgi:phage-related tail protein